MDSERTQQSPPHLPVSTTLSKRTIWFCGWSNMTIYKWSRPRDNEWAAEATGKKAGERETSSTMELLSQSRTKQRSSHAETRRWKVNGNRLRKYERVDLRRRKQNESRNCYKQETNNQTWSQRRWWGVAISRFLDASALGYKSKASKVVSSFWFLRLPRLPFPVEHFILQHVKFCVLSRDSTRVLPCIKFFSLSQDGQMCNKICWWQGITASEKFSFGVIPSHSSKGMKRLSQNTKQNLVQQKENSYQLLRAEEHKFKSCWCKSLSAIPPTLVLYSLQKTSRIAKDVVNKKQENSPSSMQENR